MVENKAVRTKILSRLFWDYHISGVDAEKMLRSDYLNVKRKVLVRLLMSASWYTLLDILTADELKEALDEEVLKRIHIPSLAKKYRHARHIIYP